MNKIYILFEDNKVKYVAANKRNVMRVAKEKYNITNQEKKMLYQFSGVTIGNPNPDSCNVFITLSIHEVETDKFINN